MYATETKLRESANRGDINDDIEKTIHSDGTRITNSIFTLDYNTINKAYGVALINRQVTDTKINSNNQC